MKELEERSRKAHHKVLRDQLGDPIDEMDFLMVKRVTVHLFLRLSDMIGESAAYSVTGDLVDHSKEYVMKTVEEFKELRGFR